MKIKTISIIISVINIFLLVSNTCKAFDLYTETSEITSIKAASKQKNADYDTTSINTSNNNKEEKQEQIRALRNKARQKRQKLHQKPHRQQINQYNRKNNLLNERKEITQDKNRLTKDKK